MGMAVIVAVGVDHAEVERIRRAVDHERWGQRFRRRVFTAGEIAYCESRKRYAESFAARFAAKEAVMKALGTGMRGVSWQEIEVAREPNRAPRLRLSGRAAQHAAALGIDRWHLALTHTAELSTAFVVAEKAGGGE
jgi:holo-[acyl-carrier protein] synthase